MVYLLSCRRLVAESSRTPICFFSSQMNSNTFNPVHKFYSTSTDESTSFTISYLINTCGLSQREAIESAKGLKLKTPDNPDSVLHCLQTHGFTKPQIKKIVVGSPLVLLARPQRTLVPKFEFLKQVGFSGDEIAQQLQKGSTCRHFFLRTSLKHRIQPSFRFIKTLLHSKEDIAVAFKRGLFELCPEKELQPKVQILKDHGVPQSSISSMLLFGSRLFGKSTDVFNKAVKEAVELGVDPSQKMFVYAVRIMSEASKVKREANFEIYKSFGWSDDEIRSAIRKQPTCIAISDEKLRIGLDFFMNQMNWKPALLAKAPNILSLSMDKRIIPRMRVLKFLISKGIFDDTWILTALKLSEANFIKKYIAKYVDTFPELRSIYQGC